MKTTHRVAWFGITAIGLIGIRTAVVAKESLEDCVGATPDAVFASDGFTDYQFTQKNKFKTVESGVSSAGMKVVLTSTRCTRNVRSFTFEFPKEDHAVKDASHWLKTAAETLKGLKVKPFFKRNANKVAAALKRQSKSRAPAAVVAKSKKWKKPMDIIIQENYETVHVTAELQGDKVVVTVTDDTSM